MKIETFSHQNELSSTFLSWFIVDIWIYCYLKTDIHTKIHWQKNQLFYSTFQIFKNTKIKIIIPSEWIQYFGLPCRQSLPSVASKNCYVYKSFNIKANLGLIIFLTNRKVSELFLVQPLYVVIHRREWREEKAVFDSSQVFCWGVPAKVV